MTDKTIPAQNLTNNVNQMASTNPAGKILNTVSTVGMATTQSVLLIVTIIITDALIIDAVEEAFDKLNCNTTRA